MMTIESQFPDSLSHFLSVQVLHMAEPHLIMKRILDLIEIENVQYCDYLEL